MTRTAHWAAFAMAGAGLVLATSAAAEHRHVVDGLVVNVGIVPAGAINDPRELAVHRAPFPSGAQHVVVSVADASSGQYRRDASVTVEVRDPEGRVERHALVPSNVGATTDYSGIFTFGWSGRYRLAVEVADPVTSRTATTTFTLSHSVQ